MTASELATSALNDPAPPAGLTSTARALWLCRAGKWDDAHDLCQDIPGSAGAWIHAWLHREEGDLGNAAYWYSRAGKPVPGTDIRLADEWLRIAEELVGG